MRSLDANLLVFILSAILRVLYSRCRRPGTPLSGHAYMSLRPPIARTIPLITADSVYD